MGMRQLLPVDGLPRQGLAACAGAVVQSHRLVHATGLAQQTAEGVGGDSQIELVARLIWPVGGQFLAQGERLPVGVFRPFQRAAGGY